MEEKMPELGERLRFVPTGFSGEKDSEFGGRVFRRMVTGTVTYIHPRGRFYMVEYEAFGVKLRECFTPNQREGRRWTYCGSPM